MILLLTYLWPALAAAFALGLGAGWLAGLPSGALTPFVFTTAIAALSGTALSGIAPGRAGLWVESAALLLPAYCAGCLVGALVKRLVRGTPEPATT